MSPTTLIAVPQFVPIIRYKALILHRINEYMVVVLLLLSNVGSLMITRHSFGGGFETQVLVGVLAIITTVGTLSAYYNIMRLQIDQHRAWMIRTWSYAASIITLRLIMIISTSRFSYSSYCLLGASDNTQRQSTVTRERKS